jgi:hypothetical protein
MGCCGKNATPYRPTANRGQATSARQYMPCRRCGNYAYRKRVYDAAAGQYVDVYRCFSCGFSYPPGRK